MNGDWDETEKLHFKDVRKIYDFLFLLAFIGVLVLVLNKEYDKSLIRKFALSNIVFMVVLFSFILPFFVYFWNQIFHLIMFNNDYWMFESGSMSSFLFPNDFFRNSIIFIGLFFILENYMLFVKNKKK